MENKKLLYNEETFAIRGACFEVYKEKSNGFLEAVYQECLEFELEQSGVPFVSRPRLEMEYKGRKLKSTFEPDLICHSKIIVELKAVSELVDEHRAQIHNYLRATKFRLGLLVNFGHFPGVEIERIVI